MKAHPPISVVMMAMLALVAALFLACSSAADERDEADDNAATSSETDTYQPADAADGADDVDAGETDADAAYEGATDEPATDDAAEQPDEDAPAEDDAEEVGLDGDAVVEQLGEGFAPTIDALTDGEINWTTGHVTVSGEGQAEGDTAQDIAMAKRAARLVAARNAILTIAQVRFGGGSLLGDVVSGEISVDAVLEGFEEVSAEFDEETHAATVVLRAPLCGAGGVINLDGVRLARRDAWPWPAGLPADSPAGVDGVVIDARHVKVAPAALPAFVTSSGLSIFDVTQLPPGQRARRPLAVYVRRDAPREGAFGPLRQARAVARQAGSADAEIVAAAGNVFDRPLVISAVETAEDEPSTLVLSAAAVRDLTISAEAHRCFEQGRVIVVIATEDD